MSSRVFPPETENSQEFCIAQVFPCGAERLWSALTEPLELVRWSAPDPADIDVLRWEREPGGKLQARIACPDGTVLWGRGVVREAAPYTRLASVVAASDSEGKARRDSRKPAWPVELLVALTLTPTAAGTDLRLEMAPWNATEQEHDAFDADRDLLEKVLQAAANRLRQYIESTPPS